MGDFDLTLLVGDSRLAKDAPQGRNVPADLVFTTSWQGGHKQLDCSLLRLSSDTAMEKPYDGVKLLGPGSISVWEGRLQRLSRTITRRTQRQAPSALGLAVILEDRQDARFLGIDRDLGAWQPMPIARRIAYYATPFGPRDASASDGALRFDLGGKWDTSFSRPACNTQYDATPLKVGRLVWQQTKGVSAAPGQWVGEVQNQESDGTGGATVEADWYADTGTGAHTATVTGSITTYTGPPRDFTVNGPRCEIVLYTGLTSSGDAARNVDITGIGVIGDHGLPVLDPGPGPQAYGIKASDAWAWLIRTYCDGLQVGQIVDSDLPIQHLAYKEAQTPGSIWNAINAYHAWSWGVWEGGFVDANPYGEGRSRTWYVRAADAGVELSQDGDDAAALWTDIVVSYQTPTGETKSVGGIGTLSDTQDAALTVTDTSNPAVAAGVKRVYYFALDVPTVQNTAVAVGRTMLAQLNASRRAGTVSVQGYATDESRLPVPVYMVRGGDQLVITDIGDLTPRRIVETTYTHSTRTVSMTVDNTRQTVEGIVAHLGARTTGRL